VFECLNGCRVIVAAMDKGLPPAIEDGPTLREVVGRGKRSRPGTLRRRHLRRRRLCRCRGRWARRIGCTDPNGLAVRLQVSASARSVSIAPP
jgi:hypothetical protein